MSNGNPTFWDLYGASAYHFPLTDQQPVVRIPIAGPPPFNTLAVVRGRVYTTSYGVADGKLRRKRAAVETNFSLAGYDSRVSPPFKHSTSVALNMIQTTDDSAFLTALDEIDGGFNDRGIWTVVVKFADMWDTVIATSTAYISSWVMCYEPPPLNLPHGAPWNLVAMPPSSRTIEWLSSSTSSSDIALEHLIKQSMRRKGRRSE